MSGEPSPRTPAVILRQRLRQAKQKVLEEKTYAAALSLQTLEKMYRELITPKIVDEDYEKPDYSELILLRTK